MKRISWKGEAYDGGWVGVGARRCDVDYVRTSLLRTLIKAERYCYSTALFMMSERPAGGGVNDTQDG